MTDPRGTMSRPKFFEPRGKMTDPHLASLADFLLSPGKRRRSRSPEAELRPRFADVLETMRVEDAAADQEFANRHAASIAVAMAEARHAAVGVAEAFHCALLLSAAGEPDSGHGPADDERREGVTLPLADGDHDGAILAPGGAPRQTPGCRPVEGAAVEAEAAGGRPLELRPSRAAALETRAQEEAEAAVVVVVDEDELATIPCNIAVVEHGKDELAAIPGTIPGTIPGKDELATIPGNIADTLDTLGTLRFDVAEAIAARWLAAPRAADVASGRPAPEIEADRGRSMFQATAEERPIETAGEEPRPIDVSSHAGQEVQGARASPPTPTVKIYRFFEVSWAVLGGHCGSPAAPRGHCFGGAF